LYFKTNQISFIHKTIKIIQRKNTNHKTKHETGLFHKLVLLMKTPEWKFILIITFSDSCLIYVIYVYWCPTHIVLCFCFLLFLRLVLYVSSFSRLSICIAPLVFSNVYGKYVCDGWRQFIHSFYKTMFTCLNQAYKLSSWVQIFKTKHETGLFHKLVLLMKTPEWKFILIITFSLSVF
jgi:hypothetical protein